MFVWYQMQLWLAGAWASVWHWGLGIGAIIILCCLAIFSTSIPLIGPYLTGTRNFFLAAALMVAMFLGGQWVGNRDATARCVAKTVVIEKTVIKAVDKAKKSTSKDPYDSPDN